MRIIEIEHRTVPTTEQAMKKFSVKALKYYGRTLGLDIRNKKKEALITEILGTGKATMHSSLGS